MHVSKRDTAGISVAPDRRGDDLDPGVDHRWYLYGGIRDRQHHKMGVELSVGPIGGFVFVAVRLQTTAAMFPFVPRASMLSLVIVPFETHEAEVRATEKTFERRERIVMVVVVE